MVDFIADTRFVWNTFLDINGWMAYQSLP